MESMIDILFDQLVDSDAAWDIKHDKATQDALNDIFDKSSLPTNSRSASARSSAPKPWHRPAQDSALALWPR